MKQFLAVCAACAAGYRSPQYKIKNKNSHEADEYGY